jgi:hypothetical protein
VDTGSLEARRATAQQLAQMMPLGGVRFYDASQIQGLAGSLAAIMGGDGQQAESMQFGDVALYLVALLIADL